MQCFRWGTFDRVTVKPRARVNALALSRVAVRRVTSCFGAWDFVLGGGMLTGAAAFVSAPPGTGKSTLALQLAASYSRLGPVVYAAGEETASQIKDRADRVHADVSRLHVVGSCEAWDVLSAVSQKRAWLVVLDSVQKVSDKLAGGGGAEARHDAQVLLMDKLKRRGVSVLGVCQVNAKGEMAGGDRLEHLPDVVVRLTGSGDAPGSRRQLTVDKKNRFGSADGVRASMLFSREGFQDDVRLQKRAG